MRSTQAIELAFLDGPADEVVFCGFGEPTMRLDVVLAVTEWLRLRRIRRRLDTNGHGQLLNPDVDVPAALAAAGLDAVTRQPQRGRPRGRTTSCAAGVRQGPQGRHSFRRRVRAAWYRDDADRRRLPGRRPAGLRAASRARWARASGPAAARRRAARPAARRETGDGRVGTRILLVDDEEAILKLLRFPLEKEGYQVVTARDGDEALETFAREALRPGHPRPHAAARRRHGGLPAHPRPEHRADHHAHRQGRRVRQGARPRDRRRRLHHQGPLQPARVPQPRARPVAARRDGAQRRGGAQKDVIKVDELEVDLLKRNVFVRGAARRPHLHRVRDAQDAHLAPRPRLQPPAPAAACLGRLATTATRARSTCTSATCARRSRPTPRTPSSSSRCATSATSSASSRAARRGVVFTSCAPSRTGSPSSSSRSWRSPRSSTWLYVVPLAASSRLDAARSSPTHAPTPAGDPAARDRCSSTTSDDEYVLRVSDVLRHDATSCHLLGHDSYSTRVSCSSTPATIRDRRLAQRHRRSFVGDYPMIAAGDQLRQTPRRAPSTISGQHVRRHRRAGVVADRWHRGTSVGRRCSSRVAAATSTSAVDAVRAADPAGHRSWRSASACSPATWPLTSSPAASSASSAAPRRSPAATSTPRSASTIEDEIGQLGLHVQRHGRPAAQTPSPRSSTRTTGRAAAQRPQRRRHRHLRPTAPCRSANPAAGELLGRQAADRGAGSTTPSRRRSRASGTTRARRGRDEDVVFVHGDRTLEAITYPVGSGADFDSIVVLRDVTAQARLERARRDFIANASHEFKTPLFSLSGFIELLDEGELSAEEQQRVPAAHAPAGRPPARPVAEPARPLAGRGRLARAPSRATSIWRRRGQSVLDEFQVQAQAQATWRSSLERRRAPRSPGATSSASPRSCARSSTTPSSSRRGRQLACAVGGGEGAEAARGRRATTARASPRSRAAARLRALLPRQRGARHDDRRRSRPLHRPRAHRDDGRHHHAPSRRRTAARASPCGCRAGRRPQGAAQPSEAAAADSTSLNRLRRGLLNTSRRGQVHSRARIVLTVTTGRGGRAARAPCGTIRRKGNDA